VLSPALSGQWSGGSEGGRDLGWDHAGYKHVPEACGQDELQRDSGQ